MKALIITPTYNEKDNIEQFIYELTAINNQLINSINVELQLLIIDDNSPDKTGEIVNRIKNTSKELKIEVIHRAKKLGLGTAFVTGYNWAINKDFNYIIDMDADLSHHPKYLVDMFDRFEQYDCIVGSRYVKSGGVKGWPVYRKILSRLGSFYARKVIGIDIKDFTSGFIAMKREALDKIDFKTIVSEGYMFNIELKYKICKAGFKLFEIPIIFDDRIAGVSKISKKIIFEALVSCWRL